MCSAYKVSDVLEFPMLSQKTFICKVLTFISEVERVYMEFCEK